MVLGYLVTQTTQQHFCGVAIHKGR